MIAIITVSDTAGTVGRRAGWAGRPRRPAGAGPRRPSGADRRRTAPTGAGRWGSRTQGCARLLPGRLSPRRVVSRASPFCPRWRLSPGNRYRSQGTAKPSRYKDSCIRCTTRLRRQNDDRIRGHCGDRRRRGSRKSRSGARRPRSGSSIRNGIGWLVREPIPYAGHLVPGEFRSCGFRGKTRAADAGL